MKVAIWESQLSEQAEPLAATTKALSQGVIPWRRKEALKKTGQFSALRCMIIAVFLSLTKEIAIFKC